MKFVSWSYKLLEEDGGGFCGGSKLECFAVFCMQMPSGADVATKAFGSSGDGQTLENVNDCRQVSWSVTDENRCAWLFGSFCSLVFQLDFSARLWIWPWSRIEELFDGCALPLLFFQRHVKAQHASAAALAEQQKQEMERQREQLSEACAVGAFSSCQGKEWRCLLHTSYQFKLIHFCWRSFLRLVIVHSVHPVEYVASWDLSVAST